MGRRLAGLLSMLGAIGAFLGGVPAEAQAQAGRIQGQVTEAETNRPLVGVQVYIEGTTLGTLTNNEGRFLIQNVRPGTYNLAAQIIGHQQGRNAGVVVTAGEAATSNFQLRTAVLSLQEVVVTGVTDPTAGVKAPFSIAKVSKENIATVPTTSSALAAIQGKAAGVSVVRGSGQPGQGVNILLRTPTSVQQSSSPLFVVDGVILSSSIGNTTLDIEALDIESVEIVKGAAAASLYGSRAASGVVAITTSRGKNLPLDQTRITVRGEYGNSLAPTGMPLSKSHHYLQSANGDWVDANGNPVTRTLRVVDADDFMDNPYTNALFDNVNNFFKPAAFHTQTVNLSHSARSTNFLTSFNQYRERGALTTNDGFTRRDFRVNLDHRLRDNFSLSVSAYHSRTSRDLLLQGTGEGGLFWDLLLTEPDLDLGRKGPDGNYVQQPDSTVAAENPLFVEGADDEDDWRTRTLGSIDLRYSPLSWLNFTGNLSYDRSDTKYRYYRPKGRSLSVVADQPSNGSLQRDDDYADALNASVQGTVLRNFGQLTTRTTVRGILEREERTTVSASGSDFWVKDVPDLSVAATRSVGSSFTDIRASGFYVNPALDYAGKYILDGLVRRDGSSLFGEDERWHTYYRIASAWRVSSENFWPWKDAINEFKLRYSVGTAGGRPGFAYQYETWSVSSTGAVSKNTLGNRNLKPEHTTEHELGVDMIFNNRYSLELTYARQDTRDQLIQLPLPAVVGYPAQWVNTGLQRGHTYEATFQAQVINRPNLSWSTTVIADRNRSKIEEWNRSCFFDGLQNVCGGSSLSEMWGERHLKSVDEVASVVGAENANQFQVNNDGYVVWVGAGNSWRDGVNKNLWGTTTVINGREYRWGIPIADLDSAGFRVTKKIGESLPDFSLGWLNNVNWRGFALHTQFHAQVGGNTYNGTRQRLYQHLRHGDLDQSGKPDEEKKTVTYYQALYNANSNTEHFVESGSYLKLRAVSLQYRFNNEQMQRIGLGANSLSLGVIGRNIFTLTNYSGLDPEVGSVLERRDTFGYPNTRQLTLTAEITF